MNRTLYFSREDDAVYSRAQKVAAVQGVSLSRVIADYLKTWVTAQTPATIRRSVDKRVKEATK